MSITFRPFTARQRRLRDLVNRLYVESERIARRDVQGYDLDRCQAAIVRLRTIRDRMARLGAAAGIERYFGRTVR
jgi:hypothetical protein